MNKILFLNVFLFYLSDFIRVILVKSCWLCCFEITSNKSSGERFEIYFHGTLKSLKKNK